MSLDSAIAKLNGYIANLSAVPAAQRTPKQTAELATYTARLLDYRARIAGLAPAPSATTAVAPPAAAGIPYATVAGGLGSPLAASPGGTDMTALASGYGAGVAIPTGGPMIFTPTSTAGAGAPAGEGSGLGLTDLAIIAGTAIALVVAIKSKGRRS